MSATHFAREFFRNWKTTGALFPSSRELAVRMCQAARVGDAERVLELGPGTGAITQVLEAMLAPQARCLALELNESFVRALHARFPRIDFVAAAAQAYDFQLYLPEGEGFDAIVSGLPWTAFPEELQRAILSHVLPRLAPGGRFVTFAYWGFHQLPGGRRFRSLLQDQPGKLTVTQIEWRNMPPAFVYVIERE
jgi:phosphatidylethanolamine/phosphatidyl-N-methylethanolamine N-methyltransferase